MTQLQIQPAAVRSAVRPVSPCRFAIRFVVSAVSSLAGLVSFSLVGSTVSRIAAVEVIALVIEAIQNTVSAVIVGPSGKVRVPKAP